MAKPQASQKRTQIDKANTTMVVTVAVAAFVFVFSLIAAHALWVRMSYQNKVISEKETARNQLVANLDTVDDLVTAYKAFAETPENVLGGNPSGKGDKDGDNAKIVLDALPSKYDFPGLVTSLEKIIQDNGSSINSISGTDDEVAQGAAANGPNQPIEIPFELSAGGNYDSTQDLLTLLQRSIRPIKAQTVQLAGTNSELELTLTAITYYQPEKTLNIPKKVVEQ